MLGGQGASRVTARKLIPDPSLLRWCLVYELQPSGPWSTWLSHEHMYMHRECRDKLMTVTEHSVPSRSLHDSHAGDSRNLAPSPVQAGVVSALLTYVLYRSGHSWHTHWFLHTDTALCILHSLNYSAVLDLYGKKRPWHSIKFSSIKGIKFQMSYSLKFVRTLRISRKNNRDVHVILPVLSEPISIAQQQRDAGKPISSQEHSFCRFHASDYQRAVTESWGEGPSSILPQKCHHLDTMDILSSF